MLFDLDKSIQVLASTPVVLKNQLSGIDPDWYLTNEGGESWSPFDIVGHMIHGEKTDWLTRIEIILSSSQYKNFSPYDRFAQFEESKGKTIEALLDEFEILRGENLIKLNAKNISISDLEKKGIHPEFGPVTLKQLISTWVVHDLNHLAQVNRVMAKQYQAEVGPWNEYLGIYKK